MNICVFVLLLWDGIDTLPIQNKLAGHLIQLRVNGKILTRFVWVCQLPGTLFSLLFIWLLLQIDLTIHIVANFPRPPYQYHYPIGLGIKKDYCKTPSRQNMHTHIDAIDVPTPSWIFHSHFHDKPIIFKCFRQQR